MSDTNEKNESREKLLEALTIMSDGISYMHPYGEARILRAWSDALMAIESEEKLRNGYRHIYASFGKGPKSFEEHMVRVQQVFLGLYTGSISRKA